jgi:hypothetical protein
MMSSTRLYQGELHQDFDSSTSAPFPSRVPAGMKPDIPVLHKRAFLRRPRENLDLARSNEFLYACRAASGVSPLDATG